MENMDETNSFDTTTITLKSTRSSEYPDEQIVCKVIPNEEISSYVESIPEKRKFMATKTASVSARAGIEGEIIHTELTTTYNGKKYILSEENNVVKVRETANGMLPDVVVTNINSTSNEQYIVKAEKFASTYEVQADGLFMPVLDPREMAQVSENVVIMTSWGEPAVCLKDSYIVTYDASKNDFNTIEQSAFESTYTSVPGKAKIR